MEYIDKNSGIIHFIKGVLSLNIAIENLLSTSYRTGLSDDKVLIEPNRTDENFSVQMQEASVESMKTEIYKKFGVNVNTTDDHEECFIPNEVLYRMNSDPALREKVFTVLADHRDAKRTLAGYYPPVKKYTLTFDKNGDVVTYILEPDMEALEKDNSKSTKNRIFSDQLSWEAYDHNIMNDSLYSAFHNIEMQSAMLQTVLIKKRWPDRDSE